MAQRNNKWNKDIWYMNVNSASMYLGGLVRLSV